MLFHRAPVVVIQNQLQGIGACTRIEYSKSCLTLIALGGNGSDPQLLADCRGDRLSYFQPGDHVVSH